jgi:hypothetical protein
MPPRDQLHFAAFCFHLGDQRGLLFNRPFSPSLNPGNDFDVGHTDLLLELQKESPATQSIGDPRPPRYTSGAGRLHRKVLNGIYWRLRTDSPWGDIPERYGQNR